MSTPLRIAVVCPTPVSPADDASWRAFREAEALARRGHRVTVLVPGVSADELSEGRRRLALLADGDAAAVTAAPGTALVVCVGRAIRAGARRRMAGPIDLATGLEAALRLGGFDIVHVHEPLLPSPALAALRHTRAATVATFHRADAVTGVAFLGPLVQRALGRVDVRIAASHTVERALGEVLPGRYTVLSAGVDSVDRTGEPPPSGVLLVARGRDRTGLRFGLRVIRAVDPALLGHARVVGPREAAWRTHASVPKVLRGSVTVIPGDDAAAWRQALSTVAVVMAMAPEDIAGPVTDEALAYGRAIIAPRGAVSDERFRHGENAVVVPPFQRDAWVSALEALLRDPIRRAALAAAARAVAPPTWDAVAAHLEDVYRQAAAGPRRRDPDAHVTADLRLRPSPSVDPHRLARACREAGVNVVAVASPEGVAAARRLAAAAPNELTVIAGREVSTTDGTVVGLFLTDDVPDGLGVEETLTRIRAQGGVTLLPHPATCRTPPPEVLRGLEHLVDCRELATGAAGPAGLEAARTARRLGMVVSAGSGAVGLDGVGSAGMAMRGFDGGRDFLEALADGEPTVPRRGRRARSRDRARSRNS